MKLKDRFIILLPFLFLFHGCPIIAAIKAIDRAVFRSDKVGSKKESRKASDTGEENQSKPPVPIPVPDCTKSTHCKQGKEECVVGEGECCTKCHQPCPIWSEEPDPEPEVSYHKDHCIMSGRIWCRNGKAHCCDIGPCKGKDIVCQKFDD